VHVTVPALKQSNRRDTARRVRPLKIYDLHTIDYDKLIHLAILAFWWFQSHWMSKAPKSGNIYANKHKNGSEINTKTV